MNVVFIFIVVFVLFARTNSILIQNDDLSSFGIKTFRYVRKIHDETSTNVHREKRSNDKENSPRVFVVELDEKNLTMILTNSKKIFSSDVQIDFGSTNSFPLDSSILYEGFLSDRPNSSRIFGGFYSNWFDGMIETTNETWHIEPIRKYVSSPSEINTSIIYNSNDIDLNRFERSKRSIINENNSSWSFCGLNDRNKVEQMANESENLDETISSRFRRENDNEEKTCCDLFIRIDSTLWTLVYSNEGLRDTETTIHALVTFLYRTISATNGIYHSVRFQYGNETFSRFMLRIKRIRILTPNDCQTKNLVLNEENLCRPFLDSNVLLGWHSAENFGQYCLSYLFSARDFGDGTLGLAWIGSFSSKSRGGICEKPARGEYEGHRVIKTLNTGVITVINHHSRVSSIMTDLTFAHEIGHSLGAEHDDEKCEGDERNGHYLMYRRATTGLETNNNIFSNCSLEKIGQLIFMVKNHLNGKMNCFSSCSKIGFCGNRNVEDDEECDCGFASECTDQCCFPADGPDPKFACKLKHGAHCSPSSGPCCSQQCRFHSSTHICHEDQMNNDCIGEVRCDGMTADCPLNDSKYFKATDTLCHHFTGLCDRGQCNKSVCTMINRTECQLTIPNIVEPLRQRGVDREYFCHIGCFDDRTNSCIDTHELRLINNQSQTGFGYKHRPGHTCAGTTGYCDVFGKCRLVDAEGPLTRLKNVFLNEENIRTLNEIFRDYWWTLLLGLLGFLGFLSIFVKICSVHTPSTNPRLRPARALSLKRQSSSQRRSLPIPTTTDERVAQIYACRSKTSDDEENNTSCL